MSLLKAGELGGEADELVGEFEETLEGIVSGRVSGIASEARARFQTIWERFKQTKDEEELEVAKHFYGELDISVVTAVLDMHARSDGYHDIPELER